MNEKELLQKRGKSLAAAEEIVKRAKEANRVMTADESEQFNRHMDDEHNLETTIRANQRLSESQRSQQEEIEERAKNLGRSTEEQKEGEVKRASAFNKYLRGGLESLNEEERTIMRDMRFRDGNEQRAQSTTGSAGGYTIPQGFANEIDRALKAYGGVTDVCKILKTATGNTVPYPKYDDTSNEGELLGENTASATQDITFGVTNLLSYKYGSKEIIVSDELMEDSAFDLQAMIIEVASERLGRIVNKHYTTGDNSSKPQGVVTAAASGATAGAAAALSFDDILSLQHSVDPAYRKSPNAAFMFNDTTLKLIKKLSIGTNYTQPLWLPSITAGEPDTILGHKYVVNQNMASVAADAISMLFGDFNKFLVREVNGIWIKRMVDKYGSQFSTGFVVGIRRDARFIGTSGAIKKLTHPSS
jgi:HK97 family phage major capsid protein